MTALRGISAIVPCEGRVELVKRLLKSLQISREKFTHSCEVIIVDSSKNKDAEEIINYCKKWNASYVKGPLNVREKRNLGARNAKYEILLYIDSDCYVKDDILEQHWKIFSDNKDEKIGGVLGITIFIGKQNFICKVVQISELFKPFNFSTIGRYSDWGTCSNLSLLKDVFFKIGKFEEKFPFKLGGDDKDFTLRMKQAGYILKNNPNAIVWHTWETWSYPRQVLSRSFRWGRLEYYMMKRFPQYTYLAMPQFSFFSLFVSIISIVSFIVFNKLVYFLFFPIWFFISTFLFTLLDILFNSKALSSFSMEYLKGFLELPYGFGVFLEGIIHFDFKVILYRFSTDNNFLENNWVNEVNNLWSNLLSLIFSSIILIGINNI